MRIKRFTLAQRLFHLLLMLSFITQAATGLGRMYIQTEFGRTVTSLFGGYEGALAIHREVGVFMVLLFVIHLIYLIFGVRRKKWFGPDSMLPRLRDAGDFFRHLGWMLGLRKQPQFERWGYWEKFDYWAVFWGMVIIGGTGLLLYDPLVTSQYFQGWSLNVAFWIHRIEAILAIAHVFIIHFVIAHLRPFNFPMDRAMFTGRASMEHMRHEKGDWIARLEDSGALDSYTVNEAPAARQIGAYVLGIAIVACGIILLVNMIIHLPLLAR